MQRQDIVNAVFHRMQRPSTWGAALLFSAAWMGVRAALGLPMQGFGLSETVIPLALLFGTLLYRSGLVPCIDPTIGLIGAPLLLTANS